MSRAKDGERPLIDQAVAGNSPVYGPGWEFPLVVAQGVAGKPGLFLPGRTVYFCPFQPGVQQDDALRLRQGLGERAGGQESGPAGGAAGPRRLLPGQYPSLESRSMWVTTRVSASTTRSNSSKRPPVQALDHLQPVGQPGSGVPVPVGRF